MFTLLTAFIQSGSIIIDKINLSRRRIPIHVYVPLIFLFLFLITLCLYPILGNVPQELLQTKNIFLFFLMIVLGICWNFFYYKGIESEKVQEFELIIMFQPLVTILLAAVFLRYENNLKIDIAAIIAAIALILSQIKKHHFELSRGAVAMMVAVLFMSAEIIVIRLVLNFMAPVTLYLMRTGIIFLFFFFYYKPRMFKIPGDDAAMILLSAIFATAQMIMKFYGYEIYGVIYTSLVLILSPMIVFISSVIYFREKLNSRTFFAAIVILACIVYATILGK